MNKELAINIENASVRLGGREIIHDMHWQVEKGGRCFILGANGAGKTTLVKTLMGYAWPKFGAKVEVLGHRFGQTNLVELRKRIAWVSPFMNQFSLYAEDLYKQTFGRNELRINCRNSLSSSISSVRMAIRVYR